MRRAMAALVVFFSFLAVLCLDASTKAEKRIVKEKSTTEFKREEILVLNLNRGAKSAGSYLIQSVRGLRIIERNLDKALNQVEQADATYARACRRPDDRTMLNTAEHLKKAAKTAKELEIELKNASSELKSDIQQTLIRP